MKVSVSTGLYYKKSYKEILDIIASTSCSNVELFLNQAFIDVDVQELKHELGKRNLKVVSIHSPLEFIVFPKGEDESYWINRCIEMSIVLGAEVIVSHMVFNKGNQNECDNLHKKNMLKFSQNKSAVITTENMPNVEDGSSFGRLDVLYNFVSKNNLNFTFDTTHCAFDGTSIIEAYKKFKPFIRNIHLSDFENGIEHKVIGDGILPLGDFCKMLKDDGYGGCLTIELDFENKKRNDIADNKSAILAIQKCIDFVEENI